MWKVYTLLTITMLLWGLQSPGTQIHAHTYASRHHDRTPRPHSRNRRIHHPGSLQTRPTPNQKRMDLHTRRSRTQRRPPPLLPQHGPLPNIRHQRQPHPRNRPSTNSNLYITHPAQLPDQNPMARRNRRLHRHRLRRPRRRRRSIRPQTRRRIHLLLHPGTSPFVFGNR